MEHIDVIKANPFTLTCCPVSRTVGTPHRHSAAWNIVFHSRSRHRRFWITLPLSLTSCNTSCSLPAYFLCIKCEWMAVANHIISVWHCVEQRRRVVYLFVHSFIFIFVACSFFLLNLSSFVRRSQLQNVCRIRNRNDRMVCCDANREINQ